jgi:UDP-N-acetylglucosamine diphosphorylase/glucosamine-1-phosphate N-acetyltransferase
MSLRERCERAFGQPAILISRPHLAPHLKETCDRQVNELRGGEGGWVLLVNGRVLDPFALIPLLEETTGKGVWWNGGEVIAARLPASETRDLLANLRVNDHILESGMLHGLPRQLAPVPILEQPWELALQNGERIVADVSAFGLRHTGGRPLPPGVHRIGGDPLILAPGAEVEPGAVLDTRGGPILVGRGARIAGLTRLEGPAAVGAGSLLVGGRIRAGTTIGPGCRVAGEVEASILHGHSNKYHDGFIGHAYVGEWVNLGAMTTNSDLKNTYGTVKVWNDGKLVDTGAQKVGVLIGDHAKTGIGSLLDTGAVIGTAANVYGGSAVLATKWIPSFAWGVPPKLTVHDPVRALATMEEVMRRRGVALSAFYRAMIEEVFTLTRGERQFAGIAE